MYQSRKSQEAFRDMGGDAENARLENAGPKCKGGKWRTQQTERTKDKRTYRLCPFVR